MKAEEAGDTANATALRAAAAAAQAAAQAARDSVQADMTVVDAVVNAELAAAMASRAAAKAVTDAAKAAKDAKKYAAEKAQRARVDAAAIQLSAGRDTGPNKDAVNLNPGTGDGQDDDTTDRGEGVGDYYSSKGVTVANFQGTPPVPGDSDDDGNEVTEAANESMMLTATHDGSMVTFKATADTDTTDTEDAMVLINLVAEAGADGMTTAMTGDNPVDLAGGHKKHIILMSNVEAPVTSAFGPGPFPDLAAGGV